MFDFIAAQSNWLRLFGTTLLNIKHEQSSDTYINLKANTYNNRCNEDDFYIPSDQTGLTLRPTMASNLEEIDITPYFKVCIDDQ